MPIDIDRMLWWSIPIACLWVVVVGVSAWLFGTKAVWMLLGAPLALYWPLWLARYGIPDCYYSANGA